MTVKYQQRIHEAFAAKLDEKAKAEFDKAKEAFPNAPMAFVPSEEALILAKGNIEICEYYYLKSDVKQGYEFEKTRTKTVEQVVRANINGYKAASDALVVEEREDFKKIYEALVKNYKEYFSLAAEAALVVAYTDYAEFAEAFTKEEERKQAKRIATRKAKAASK